MGTPVRPRADIRSERRGLTVSMGSSEAVSQTSFDDNTPFSNIYKIYGHLYVSEYSTVYLLLSIINIFLLSLSYCY